MSIMVAEPAQGLKDRGGAGRPQLLFWVLLTLFISAGCAAGVRTSLVEMDLRLASPLFSRDAEATAELPVVYPAAARAGSAAPVGAVGSGAFPLADFGPAWRGLEPVYSEYRFNPFNP